MRPIILLALAACVSCGASQRPDTAAADSAQVATDTMAAEPATAAADSSQEAIMQRAVKTDLEIYATQSGVIAYGQVVRIDICKLDGRVVRTVNDTQFCSTSKLPDGRYIVRAVTRDGQYAEQPLTLPVP